jgi:hypothetical protein
MTTLKIKELAADRIPRSSKDIFPNDVWDIERNTKEEPQPDMVDIHPSRTRRIRSQPAEIAAAAQRNEAQRIAYHLHHEAQRKIANEPKTK